MSDMTGEGRSPSIPEPKEEESKGRASERWQTTTRQHLGTTINLILTLTLAALGFALNLLIPKESGVVQSMSGARYYLILMSLWFLVVAVLFGICVNLTRLSDFRWTYRSARLRDVTAELPRWVERLTRGKSWLESIWDAYDERTINGKWVPDELTQWKSQIKSQNDTEKHDARREFSPRAVGGQNQPDSLLRLYAVYHDYTSKKADALGRTTRFLFWSQLLVFFIGIALLTIGLWLQINSRITAPPKDDLHALTEHVDKIATSLSQITTQLNALSKDRGLSPAPTNKGTTSIKNQKKGGKQHK